MWGDPASETWFVPVLSCRFVKDAQLLTVIYITPGGPPRVLGILSQDKPAFLALSLKRVSVLVSYEAELEILLKGFQCRPKQEGWRKERHTEGSETQPDIDGLLKGRTSPSGFTMSYTGFWWRFQLQGT